MKIVSCFSSSSCRGFHYYHRLRARAHVYTNSHSLYRRASRIPTIIHVLCRSVHLWANFADCRYRLNYLSYLWLKSLRSYSCLGCLPYFPTHTSMPFPSSHPFEVTQLAYTLVCRERRRACLMSTKRDAIPNECYLFVFLMH